MRAAQSVLCAVGSSVHKVKFEAYAICLLHPQLVAWHHATWVQQTNSCMYLHAPFTGMHNVVLLQQQAVCTSLAQHA